jgi:hypothetical protein
MDEEVKQAASDEKNTPLEREKSPAEVRQEHIRYEAIIKSVGILYYLGALLFFFSAVGGFFTDQENTLPVRVVVAVFLAGMGIIQIFVGTGLRRLDARARVPAIILSCIGLLGFPIGTLINGYILCVILSRKGAAVFTDEYKNIISATPEVKYKTSKAAWIVLCLLLVVLLFIIIASVL